MSPCVYSVLSLAIDPKSVAEVFGDRLEKMPRHEKIMIMLLLVQAMPLADGKPQPLLIKGSLEKQMKGGLVMSQATQDFVFSLDKLTPMAQSHLLLALTAYVTEQTTWYDTSGNRISECKVDIDFYPAD